MNFKNIISGLLCSFFLCPQIGISQNTAEQYLLVGTYTRKNSEGIYVYKFNLNTGDFSRVSVASGIKNPSFLAVSPNQKFVYAVSEISDGIVYSYSFDKNTGMLTNLNTQSAGGADPCHISVDKTGKWVLVGNYSGGNLSILPVEPNGSLSAASQTINHSGSGPNKGRQEKPHVHSVNISPNNRDVFVPDLGIDKIMTYSLNAQNGKLVEGKPAFTKVADGSGPRHFTIHPNGKFVYVIQELSSTVTAFNYVSGKLSPIQTITTLAKDFKYKNKSFCADIHISPDGKFLYGSNRFVDAGNKNGIFAPNNTTDTIVIYSIDPKTGKLTYIGNEPVLGKIPRNFMITPNGKFVLVANQETDNITIFNRDAKTGKLSPTGKQIEVPVPVCLKMIDVK
ncbi:MULTISPECIES: lactonase family protein [Emticicia]|uniref:lactonase family protein n=1 Tax=Emticicia TaxID=312278 RepID=UPI0007D8BDC7|nr:MULTISPECIES: lactonase family protein [Emticicia]